MPDDLDALFRRHHRELQRYAREGLRDRSQAADIVQDAFLRYAMAAQGRGDAPRPIANPVAFLWQVVRNIVRDHGRQHRRRGAPLDLQEFSESLADPRPSAERILVARQEFLVLRAALDELPRHCRLALLLSRTEGLTHPEIARHLGISTSMVTKHVIRALRHCTRRLSAHLPLS
ncbi:RNA polymerase sigma factor [Siccirubricoccus phaeus]|uniref:RNA polymerase sigma factor n=1 Tax=Siccirubricoccus phaeus TaxID=2595053 RepID=UPI0011F36133|nr:sigma-70 family RNA polymerase sigma factor [Siccirubricoccus phaeus]